MGPASRKKIWTGAGALLLALIFFSLYFIRRETYELNKTVRLAAWRIIQFEELARHRKLTYKIEFLKDRYSASLLVSGPEDQWKEVASYPYEDSLQTTLPGFTFIIEKGRIVSYQWEGSRGELRSTLVLGFFHPRNPTRQKGILFLENGDWRAL